MDILAIQQMAHSLILTLLDFNSQDIVREKSEDGAAIRKAGDALSRVGNKIETTAEDGLVSEAEMDELKAVCMEALDALKAAGAEIKDQSFNEPEEPTA